MTKLCFQRLQIELNSVWGECNGIIDTIVWMWQNAPGTETELWLCVWVCVCLCPPGLLYCGVVGECMRRAMLLWCVLLEELRVTLVTHPTYTHTNSKFKCVNGGHVCVDLVSALCHLVCGAYTVCVQDYVFVCVCTVYMSFPYILKVHIDKACS